MLKYGQYTPPDLNLSAISQVPIGMFIAMQDPLVHPDDARWLRDTVKNVVHYSEYENYDHASFTKGKDMQYLDHVLTLMAKYNK